MTKIVDLMRSIIGIFNEHAGEDNLLDKEELKGHTPLCVGVKTWHLESKAKVSNRANRMQGPNRQVKTPAEAAPSPNSEQLSV